ncbi:MAG: tRNA pseudouridine(55) synthase TruB, partial [Bdellovibrionaceae bacterium]|nr:tRNA pseudouridine(55) synthase TruB [Pseudobdellovibrionaceae bacterium]
MNAKKNPSPFHGLLLINKDPGGTSHDVVAKVRRILQTREVGHAGTLDPIAGGLMVLLIGEGTKLSHYILEGNKSYRAGLRLGVVTDTLDVTGEILREAPVQVGPEAIRQAALDLQGEFEWEVPLYSAVKVQGKRLHEYAREGAEVVRPRKIMKFWDVEVGEIKGSEFEVHLHCSKGSFIRSWIHQLGQNLGCGAAMASLVRTSSTPYDLSQAMTLSQLEEAWEGNPADLSCMVPMAQALPWAKRVRVRGHDQSLLLNGQISHDLRANLITQFRPGLDTLIQVHSEENELLALVGVEPNRGF